MSKILFIVSTGVFIGAVIYELINRLNPKVTRKVENIVSHKIDDMLGVNDVTAHNAHASV